MTQKITIEKTYYAQILNAWTATKLPKEKMVVKDLDDTKLLLEISNASNEFMFNLGRNYQIEIEQIFES